MNTHRSYRIRSILVILSLILGQALSGAGLAQQPDLSPGESWANYFPLVTRSLGYRESTGVLDTSFGEGGEVRTDIHSRDELQDMLVLPDGKILALGWSYIQSYTTDFALVRYNADGSLDTSFDGDGKVLTDFGSMDTGFSLALQPDGKIIAVGITRLDGKEVLGMARYNADGSLDTSFGGDGLVVSYFGSPVWENCYSAAVQVDGKIVVAGSVLQNPGSNDTIHDFTVTRFHPDGSLDVDFGNDGIVITDFYGQDDYTLAVAVQADGKIVVGGEAGDCPYACFAVARYNPDGSLDASFNDDGRVTMDLDTDHDHPSSMILQPDGKIIVAGSAWRGVLHDANDALVRFNPDGSLDLGFGSLGRAITDWGFATIIRAIALQPDGKIIVAGNYYSDQPSIGFVLSRYNADGSLDTSFGNLGAVVMERGQNDMEENDQVKAVALQPDGKIILAAKVDGGEETSFDFGLLRFR